MQQNSLGKQESVVGRRYDSITDNVREDTCRRAHGGDPILENYLRCRRLQQKHFCPVAGPGESELK
jgi:hypothetical protein